MSTKEKLLDILTRVDSPEARDAVKLYRSKWTFRFRSEGQGEWNAGYSVRGFLDEAEAVSACLREAWWCVGDHEFHAYESFEVEIANEEIGFERKLVCYFDGRGEPQIHPDPESAQEMEPS